jgi:fructose-1,6-bisphosphatase/sedoheptulose 1,7-bisphosphatase-like protein
VDGNRASSSSVVMRTRFRTTRKIYAIHDLSKKTIRLRSANGEVAV